MNTLCKYLVKIIAIATCLITTCHADETSEMNETETSKVSYLFVMHAEQVRLVPNPSNSLEGTLTFDNVDPDVVFFSDRPARHAGKILTKSFLDQWAKTQGSFAKDAPNASLVANYSTKDNLFTDQPLILSKPDYSANNGKTIVFQIKSLTDKPLKAISAPGPFLFTDNSGCSGGSIDCNSEFPITQGQSPTSDKIIGAQTNSLEERAVSKEK